MNGREEGVSRVSRGGWTHALRRTCLIQALGRQPSTRQDMLAPASLHQPLTS